MAEKVNIETPGIGDVAAEILEAAKNLTTQERIKIAQLFRDLQKGRNQEAAKLYDEIRAIEAQVHRVADAWDREHEKPKIDGWKFLRNLASYVTGEIDKRSK